MAQAFNLAGIINTVGAPPFRVLCVSSHDILYKTSGTNCKACHGAGHVPCERAGFLADVATTDRRKHPMPLARCPIAFMYLEESVGANVPIWN